MKKIKIIFIALFAIILVFSSVNLALAYNNSKMLIYNGKTKSFNYSNSSQKDMFDNFKEVMPGDTLSQEVKIKAINLEDTIDMYMNVSAVGFNIYDYANFKIYGNDKLLFNSDIDNDTMILINKFKNNEEYNLKLVMNISEEVGNEVEDVITNLKISFVVEDNEKTYNVPKTYDDGNIYLNLVLLIISLIMIIILLCKKEKKTAK